MTVNINGLEFPFADFFQKHSGNILGFGQAARDITLAFLGLAFKPDVTDFRESPARLVAATLARRHGARIHVVEPYAAELPREFEDTGASLIDIDTALEDCDLLIVLVDHDVFKSVPLEDRLGKQVLDTRGIWPDQPKPAATVEPLRAVGA